MNFLPPLITIGIQDTGTEESLMSLLLSIRDSSTENWQIGEIIVFTSKKLPKLKHFPIPLRYRLVKSKNSATESIRFLFKKAKGSILVNLDSSIQFSSNTTLVSLIKPFFGDKEVHLVSARVLPFEKTSFIESAYANYVHSRVSLEHLFDPTRYAYSLSHQCFAIASSYARTIKIPEFVLAPHLYLFIETFMSKYSFVYARRAQVQAHFPKSYTSALRSIIRTKKSLNDLNRYSEPTIVSAVTHLPLSIELQITFLQLLTNPLSLLYRVWLSLLYTAREVELRHVRSTLPIKRRQSSRNLPYAQI